jgi:hypothetical protein
MNLVILTNDRVAPVVPTSEHKSTYAPRGVRTPMWQFQPGDRVYVRDWIGSGLIMERVSGLAWPHYLIMNGEGHLYRVSQIMLASRPLWDGPA